MKPARIVLLGRVGLDEPGSQRGYLGTLSKRFPARCSPCYKRKPRHFKVFIAHQRQSRRPVRAHPHVSSARDILPRAISTFTKNWQQHTDSSTLSIRQ